MIKKACVLTIVIIFILINAAWSAGYPEYSDNGYKGEIKYTVKKGDTSKSIAEILLGDTGKAGFILEYNNLSNDGQLEPGKRISIPLIENEIRYNIALLPQTVKKEKSVEKTGGNPTVNKLIALKKSGNEKFKKRMYIEAIKDYQQALTIKKDDKTVLNNLAIAYTSVDRYDSSVHYLSKCLALAPDDGQVVYNLAVTFQLRNSIDSAVDCYMKALDLKTTNKILKISIHNNLGVAYDGKGYYDTAIEEFKKVMDIDSRVIMTYNNMGIVYCHRGQIEESNNEYKKLIDMGGDSVSVSYAYNNLANNSARMGDWDTSVEYYKRATAITSDFEEAYYNCGNVYDDMGMYDEAIAMYEESLRIKPDDEDAVHNLKVARWHKRLKQMQAERQVAQKEEKPEKAREGVETDKEKAFVRFLQLTGGSRSREEARQRGYGISEKDRFWLVENGFWLK